MWTPEQLKRRGASKTEIERRRKGDTKVRHGVYTEDPEDPWGLYRLRCLAVAHSITGAVLAGPSAAALWGLSAVGSPPAHVYIRNVTPGRYGADVKVVGGGQPDVVTHNGLHVTSVAWTVADCARTLGQRDALIIADCALHQRLCALADVQEAARSLGRAKNIARVRWVIVNADPASESPGETWLRMIVKDLGFAVTSQVWVCGPDFSARVDLLVNGKRVVLEFDGLIKYNGEDPEAIQATIRAEKLRQADLEELGFQVLRVIWEQLSDPEGLKKRIAYAVFRAGIEGSAAS